MIATTYSTPPKGVYTGVDDLPIYHAGTPVKYYLSKLNFWAWREILKPSKDRKIGLASALRATGLDQHPAFKDLDRVELAIRCCGGDPDEVCLLDLANAAKGPEPAHPQSRALYVLLASHVQKEGLAQ